MKKKIVYFLCNIKLYGLACKISPSLAWAWSCEQSRKSIVESLTQITEQVNDLAAAFEKLNKEYQIKIKSNEVTNNENQT